VVPPLQAGQAIRPLKINNIRMKKIKWTRIIYYAGVTALIIGILDPLEGSVVITAGSLLLTLAAFLSHDRHLIVFLLSSVLIVTGVSFMFYFSSLGGFGGKSTLSWWWGILILPYPAGWITTIVLLIKRLVTGNPGRQRA
jgi:phosphotransferase system  glucose/maltose/N-acetylglucosamine-specific IIC component